METIKRVAYEVQESRTLIGLMHTTLIGLLFEIILHTDEIIVAYIHMGTC